MNRMEKLHTIHMMVNSLESLCAIHNNYQAQSAAEDITKVINKLAKEVFEDQPEPDEPTNNARNHTSF